MKLLAIDTSTEACSAALYQDADIAERFEIAPRRHAELVLPMCEQLLAEAGLSMTELDGLAFGRGPGAFTGVRIATGVIQGMAWAAELPVVGVSSLAALAMTAVQQHGCEQVATAIDARMNEVYWACYRQTDTGVTLLGEESVVDPAKVSVPEGKWFAVGTGWKAYEQVLSEVAGQSVVATDTECYPRAAAIAQLAAGAFARGEQRSAEQAIPVYLRDNVADKKK